MSGELQEALERHRCYREAKVYSGDLDLHPVELARRRGADLRVIADAYASEHLPDDDEPATVGWCESIGLTVDIDPDWDYPLQEKDCIHFWILIDDSAIWSDRRTRGDVRLICRGLGIQVKESKES